MAIAKSVCGDCGATLSPGDRFCPQCGSQIENATSAVPQSSQGGQATHCGVCGNSVKADSVFCESCGASLQRGSGRQSPNTPKDVRPTGKHSSSQRKEARERPRLESWQIITGIVVLALVVFFGYTELTREQPVLQTALPQNFQAQSAAVPPEIEQLQRLVDANPADVASLLKLANMLHDASISNPGLLTRAIETYSSYLDVKPDDPNARVDMGICYFEMARIDSTHRQPLLSRALQEMQTAFDRNPTHQPAAFNLGIVNLNAGNLDASTRWLKKTVDLDSGSDLGQRAKRLLEQHTFQGSPN